MSLFQNAIDSIEIGVKDYEDEDDKRNVSVVRNIFAGILLLYKEKLRRLSPGYNKELLIKQNIQPVKGDNDDIIYKGIGNRTVDVQSIKERFKSLKVTVDWNRFDKINKLRNDLEHYYTSKSSAAVREIIAKSFLLIRDFLVNELDENPEEILDPDCWSYLLNVSEVYTAEEDSCKATIEAIDWKYESVKEALKHLQCNACYSSLIDAPYPDDSYPTINLHCKSCGNDFSFDNVVEKCIKDSLYREAFLAVKNGGVSPYDTCYECGLDTFIHEEGCCITCGYEMAYSECGRCGTTLTLDDQVNEGLCGYCQHLFDKDD